MLRGKFFLVVAAVAAIFFNSTVWAAVPEKLKVGYVVNTSFIDEEPSGRLVGYGYEYMEFLKNYVPCEFEYIVYDDWTDLLNSLQNGEVDIIPNVPGDHRYLVNAKSTDHVVGRFPMELVIRPEDIKPHVNLARVRTNYDTPGLDEIARQEGFTYTLIPYKTYQNILDAYKNGEVDGYVDAMLFYNKQKPTYAVFDRQNYRLSVRADREDLLNRLNWAMDQLLMHQSNIRDVLKQKYFLKEGFPLLLTRSEKEFLAEKKKFRTAVLFYEKPRVYRNAEGKITGLMPDIIDRVARDLDVEIEIVETKTYTEARNLIEKGEIDFIADAIVDFSWAKKYNINPTQAYFQMDYVPVTRENYQSKNLLYPKVACVANMFCTTNFIEKNFPKEDIIYLENFGECLKAVKSGRADVVYINRDSVNDMIEDAGIYDLEIGTVSPYSQTIGLGVFADGDLRLWHILNKEINHIDVSWVRDTLNKHQQVYKPYDLKKFIYHNPIRIVLFVAALILLIAAFIYKRNMDKKNFEMVQKVAYTDFRYDLPNIRWLEKEIPQFQEKYPYMKTGFVVFSMKSSAVMTENAGFRIMDKQFHALADGLKNSDAVEYLAAGIDSGHLICFCKADPLEQLSDWAADVIKKYSYVDTADANAKIVIHMKAGISRYDACS